MSESVALGVIGVGFMGKLLARVSYELPYVNLDYVSDIDEKRGREIARKYNAKYRPDYQTMLEEENLDAIIVATPEFVHKDPVIKAARNEVDIFVEKPLATNLNDATTMIETCEEEDVKLMVGYILRFETCYVKMKQAIDEGNIGRFLSAYARRNASIQEAERLGGRTSVINYLSVHDIDQILWYNSSEVVSVYSKAVKGKVWEKYDTPDFVWTTFEFADGSLGIVESGWGLPENWANWQTPPAWSSFGDVQMEVVGTDGALFIDFNPMNLIGVDLEGWKFPDTRHWPSVNGKIAGAVKLELEHFFNCIMEDNKPLVDGEDGRRSLEVSLAAERSLESGKKVELPLSNI